MFTTKNLSRFVIILLTVIFCSLITETAFAMATDETDGAVLYVKVGGNSDCSSWEQACELQTALYITVPGDQIWVAAGTYKPTTSSNRSASFEMKSGVAIYGGFPADGGDWSLRNWETNTTTLSGDIGVQGDNSDNSYHVVKASENDETAIIDGFVITAGNASGANDNQYGGGMYVFSGSPTIINIIFSTNSASFGGGMRNYQYGNPTLTNVTFSGNTAGYYGGGMYNYYSSSPTLTDATFSTNTASSGGGMYNNYFSSPTLTDVTFSTNTASSGGGISNYDNSSPTLTNVTFSTNTAGHYGGGMYNSNTSPILTNVIFSTNEAMDGGGIYNYYSSPILSNVSFSANSGSAGGGMYNYDYSSPILINVAFSTNSALSGGGMLNNNSSPTLVHVTFSANAATQEGGGINNSNSSPTLTNVTFSTNTANRGGGMYNHDYSNPMLTNVTFSLNTVSSYGGGLYNSNSSPTLTNVTIVNNSAISGGGIYCSGENNLVTGTNSILWGNIPNQAIGETFLFTYSDIQGGYSGEGNINTDPQLGPLEDNGGFTLTHALLPGSPAIDIGDINSCPSTDQRLYVRPVDGNDDGIIGCDMGAYEYGSYPATYTIDVSTFGNGYVTKEPEKDFYDYGDIVTLTAIADPGWTFGGWSGDASGLENPISLTVTNDLSVSATFTQDEYTLSVSINPPEQGTVTISPIKPFYHYGDVVELTANPALGWSFASWSGDATGTDNPVEVTITGNTNVTANFTQNEYTLSVSVDPENSGTVGLDPAQETYHYGDVVELTATPELGWSFANWTGDAAGSENPLSITITGDMSITANFTQDEYTLMVIISPENGGSVTIEPAQQTYHYGDQVTLTATANPSWSFARWSGDASGSDNPLTITILGNTEITANFQKFWLYLPLISR